MKSYTLKVKKKKIVRVNMLWGGLLKLILTKYDCTYFCNPLFYIFLLSRKRKKKNWMYTKAFLAELYCKKYMRWRDLKAILLQNNNK